MFREQISQRDTTNERLHVAPSGYIPQPAATTRTSEESLVQQWQDLTQRLLQTEDGREFFRAFLQELK